MCDGAGPARAGRARDGHPSSPVSDLGRRTTRRLLDYMKENTTNCGKDSAASTLEDLSAGSRYLGPMLHEN